MEVRKGDLLTTVETHEEAVRVVKTFFQFYRENGRWKERTYDFVPRVGLEEIRKHVLYEDSGEPERLRERLAEAKAASFDPWQERIKNKTKNQFAGTVSSLLAALRFQGIAAVEEVEAVVLETDSSFSVVKRSGFSYSALADPAKGRGEVQGFGKDEG